MTDTDLVYTYGKESVISVDEYGVLSALSEGTVTVTATTESGISTSFTVTVYDSDFIPMSGDINLDGSVNVLDLARLKKHLAGITGLLE